MEPEKFTWQPLVEENREQKSTFSTKLAIMLVGWTLYMDIPWTTSRPAFSRAEQDGKITYHITTIFKNSKSYNIDANGCIRSQQICFS